MSHDIEALKKAATVAVQHGKDIGEGSWYSSEEIEHRFGFDPGNPDAAFIEFATPIAVLELAKLFESRTTERDRLLEDIRMLVAKLDLAESQQQRTRAVFHVNMMRAHPGKSHEEIQAEIDRALGPDVASSEGKPSAAEINRFLSAVAGDQLPDTEGGSHD